MRHAYAIYNCCIISLFAETVLHVGQVPMLVLNNCDWIYNKRAYFPMTESLYFVAYTIKFTATWLSGLLLFQASVWMVWITVMEFWPAIRGCVWLYSYLVLAEDLCCFMLYVLSSYESFVIPLLTFSHILFHKPFIYLRHPPQAHLGWGGAQNLPPHPYHIIIKMASTVIHRKVGARLTAL